MMKNVTIFSILLVLSFQLVGQTVSLKHLSTYSTGIFDESAAEISAYNKDANRLCFTNAFSNSVEILDISNVLQPVSLHVIDISPYGGTINSVVAFDNYFAVAVAATIEQDPGKVVVFTTDGLMVKQFTVGALPDMIAVSPDETKLLVANEGEPNDDYTVDPEGSISIIDVSNGVAAATVSSLTFDAFEYTRNSFEGNTNDNWNFVATPSPYDVSGDVWGVKTTISSINPLHNSSFWAMRDLDNSNGGGNFSHTLDFDAVNISTKPRATVSFKYYTIGYESSDSIGYILEMNNGTTWDMANYVPLEKDTSWTLVSVSVPAGTEYVRIRLMANQNGGSDYAAFDDVKISYLDESTRIFGNNSISNVRQDLEPEYITVSENSDKAWVSLQENNALAIIDLTNNEVIDIVGCGFKDHNLAGNGLDASDKSGAINIRNWPVKGMFQPDAINRFTIAGQNYVITANEGDARDYDGYSEEDRCEDLTLDANIFPNFADLQDQDSLGRIKITYANGDVDFDGEYEEIYTYGARSFSIFDENGALVFDSGDQFEQILASQSPAEFNSTNDDNTSFKKRSDDKGCEPEAVITAQIYDRTFAFIGLERMSGIMVYDVTNPTSPVFIQYLNNRDFSLDADDINAGDLGPEGLVFIPKAYSPNKRDLIISSNEVSGTVSIFQLDINRTINDDYALENFLLDNAPMIGVYGDTIYEGGISGLHYQHNSNNAFYLITDRGPNAVANDHPLATGPTKFFPFPSYAPKIISVTADAGIMSINSIETLKRPGGADVSGIPLPIGQGSTGEIACSDTLATVVNPDVWGIDSEGIVESNQGDLWICDEFGSSIWRLNSQCKEVIERYTPFPAEMEDIALESMIGKRRPNRGFEGVAYTPNGKIYAILQSPVYNPSSATSDGSRIHRLVEIDPTTGVMQQFAYVHDLPIGEIRNKDWKIGDLVAVDNNEFLVLEHAERKGWNYKNVFKINISGATPITVEDFGGSSLENLVDAQGLAANGIQAVSKEPFLDLLELNWNLQHDKPEGITILNDSTIAVVNDNDYGIDSPDDDGRVVFTGKETQLYIYHLPVEKHLNYVIPYCELTLAADTTICSDDYLVLDGGMASFYNWNTGSMMPFEVVDGAILNSGNYTYWLEVMNQSGCLASDTIVVTIDQELTVNLGVDTVLCQGSSIVLDAGLATSYMWSTGETTASITVDQTDFYTVTVTNTNGCESTDSRLVEVVTCTGITPIDEADFKLFPNPAQNEIQLEINTLNADSKLEIVNVTGQVVWEQLLVEQKSTINISSIANGTYFVVVQNGKERLIRKLLIAK